MDKHPSSKPLLQFQIEAGHRQAKATAGLFLLRILKVYRIDESIRMMDIRIHSVYVKEGPRQSSRTSGHDGSTATSPTLVEGCRGEQNAFLSIMEKVCVNF